MKLTEITKKDKFVGNLKDPAIAEINAIVDKLNDTIRGYSFKVYGAEKIEATIFGMPPRMGVETPEFNMIEYIKSIVSKSEHWDWIRWGNDVEEEFAVKVGRRA